MASKVLNSIR